ncbi:MAG TPA: TonB family protein [Thermoanaerobaculia bacterium]|jgi:TonB family protein|nr:TonB family protein [Thermoanaerobaculia bacterium]
MNIPEEFGKYLLLKKLTEDPLGETFRAGRVGQTGMEQVVLLRVFNGKGLDGERLWTKVSNRAAVQQVLKSPNIGNGVDLGRVRSFPYAAYDYISGKNLATVFAQSARQLSPIPTDHALLIAERLSLALAAAYESRVQDERVLHGFVVPHLVMISNEGETRLLGFEVSPGLRDLAAGNWQDETVRPYLAPEVLAGSPLTKSDDVYSLGAILFELLTGQRLPAAGPEGYASVIDGAELANEGTPLPAPVAALLKKSLVPREQRVADAVTWHKTLSKLMIDGQFSPTTFNLAFFMHNLFREEIERENQEIQAEKKLELTPRPAPVPVVAAAAAPAVSAAPVVTDMREKTGVRQGTLPGTLVSSAQSAEPSKKGLWIGLAAAAVLVLAGGGWFLFGRSGGDAQMADAGSPPPAISPTTQPAAMPGSAIPSPGTAEPAAPAGPTPEEIQAQIQQMFEARSKEMESKLKTQYDDRIKQLQQQLADSKAGTDPSPSRPVPQELAPIQVETKRPEPPPFMVPEVKKPEPAPVQTAPANPAPAPAQVEREEKPAVPTQTAPANPAPAPAPRQQQVQVGDLVQPGPGVSAPKLTSKLDPRYPPAAQRMNRAAQVDIKVLVDEKGRVLDAERIGAKAGFGFDEAALDAARRAVFQPATKEGVRVKMWTTLRVNFKGM